MPVTTIGDMAQNLTSLRAGSAIKSDLARLSANLSSGRVADVTRHLGAQTSQYVAINHALEQIAGYQQVIRETDQVLDAMQLVLTKVDTQRGQLTDQLLLVNGSSNAAQVDSAALAARDGLDVMVRALNTQINDRSLFAGRDVDTVPLLNAAAMIADIVTTIGPDRSDLGIAAAVDAWFDDPAGGFARDGYLGDADGLLQRKLSPDKQIAIPLRADDPALRQILKSAALAAVTTALPGIAATTKSDLVQKAATNLFAAASGLADTQARIGQAQTSVTETATELNAQQTGFRMTVNDLVQADPFETATRLQSVQLQLETHFTLVGRLSQLNLLRFI